MHLLHIPLYHFISLHQLFTVLLFSEPIMIHFANQSSSGPHTLSQVSRGSITEMAHDYCNLALPHTLERIPLNIYKASTHNYTELCIKFMFL